MTLLAIPNLSEGRRQNVMHAFRRALLERAGRVLDVHADPAHNRSVITLTADADLLPGALAGLATAALQHIDLTLHRGVHPRLGTLDVCPIVPHGESITAAVEVAREVGAAINSATGVPVFLYGAAASRDETRDLPALRRGGLAELIRRAEGDLPPDIGSDRIDPARGVVCVGARDVLIAFNVWLRCDLSTAREIARRVRAAHGGPPAIRSLGLAIDEAPTSQVSMNLIDPATTGIDRAFDAVAKLARLHAVEIAGSEMVGLVPERFMPDPDGQAARMLIAPGRSLESALSS